MSWSTAIVAYSDHYDPQLLEIMSKLARNTGAILSSELSGSFTVRVWSPPADEAAERLCEAWWAGFSVQNAAFYPGRHSPVRTRLLQPEGDV